MAVAGKKDPLKKQKDSLNFKNNAVQKLSRLEQAQKTIDSASVAIKYNDTLMAIKRRISKSGGVTTSNEGLYNENLKSEERRSRAHSILYGTTVGPKKKKSKTPMGRK